eukprot:TRINITY_DN2623_c0_g2_i1.p1 TRINITY_DN2623_c0_g2~~TRINITY_DN2623_c0_g2_i1.p1  ORF type:complete len:340 (+),score=73.45 TRINITY_DN2623_c0_g2_i1:46-1065(+)
MTAPVKSTAVVRSGSAKSAKKSSGGESPRKEALTPREKIGGITIMAPRPLVATHAKRKVPETSLKTTPSTPSIPVSAKKRTVPKRKTGSPTPPRSSREISPIIKAGSAGTGGVGLAPQTARRTKKKKKVKRVIKKQRPVSPSPTPTQAAGEVKLLPPQRDEWGEVYTVVLDMDETLLSHPKLGEVHERPGARDLVKGLKGKCEVILWTASTRTATEVALESLNLKASDFTHVITRSDKWFSWKTSAKDIRYLNRNSDKIVVIENSPFCIELNRRHGILVRDFNKRTKRDDTLFKINRIIQNLLVSNLDVPTFLESCECLKQRAFKLTAASMLTNYYCMF